MQLPGAYSLLGSEKAAHSTLTSPCVTGCCRSPSPFLCLHTSMPFQRDHNVMLQKMAFSVPTNTLSVTAMPCYKSLLYLHLLTFCWRDDPTLREAASPSRTYAVPEMR